MVSRTWNDESEKVKNTRDVGEHLKRLDNCTGFLSQFSDLGTSRTLEVSNIVLILHNVALYFSKKNRIWNLSSKLVKNPPDGCHAFGRTGLEEPITFRGDLYFLTAFSWLTYIGLEEPVIFSGDLYFFFSYDRKCASSTRYIVFPVFHEKSTMQRSLGVARYLKLQNPWNTK